MLQQYLRAMGMLIAGAGFAPQAFAQWVFARVADSQTLLPSNPPHTTSFFQYPSGTGGFATFGTGPPGNDADGLYTNRSGNLGVIVQQGTSAPGGGTFTQFGIPSSDGVGTAFRASTTLTSGIYREDSGAVSLVADRNTLVPGTNVPFSLFTQAAVDGQTVAFGGAGGGRSGIYTRRNGVLAAVVDTTTPVPGGNGAFSAFAQPSTRAGDLVFFGVNATERSIIRSANNSLSVIADIRTPVPNGTGTFANVSLPSTDGANVAFVGGSFGTDNSGVYVNIGGQNVMVADQSTPLPGAGLFLNAVGPVSTWGGAVVFFANATAGGGLYYWRNGQITRIVCRGDTLNGHDIATLGLSSESLFQDRVSFWMSEPGVLPQAIYTATLVPAPGVSLILASAGLLSSRRQRRSS